MRSVPLVALVLVLVAGCARGASSRRDGSGVGPDAGDGGSGTSDGDPGMMDAPPSACSADTDCDDSDACNGTETCIDSACVVGTPVSCDDGVACTVDACDPSTTACAHTPDHAICTGGMLCDPVDGCSAGPPCETDTDCDDSVFCNGAERCEPATGCVAGTPPACDDAVDCTVGRCDATSDLCAQDPDDAVCQDGLACNGSERCDATGGTTGTGCLAGTPMDCDDGIACTTDACDEPGTCTHGGSDADGDGYTALGCGAGDDCDDLSNAVHPGAAEICDGLNNDCSGGIDDGAGMSCALGSAPVACTTTCGGAGARACDSACALGPCAGAAELCNDCDDDADGMVDEGLACRRGTSAACTTGCGTTGTQTCAGDCSGYGACSATEVCNGCDDDGVSGPDNGFACVRASSRSCATGCGTTGSQTCNGTCTGYGACSATEVCNGCDDDGVGGPDNGFACVGGSSRSCTTGCGTTGSQACNGTCSGYGACSATEVCNGCDDDGVGGPDNGFACVGGSWRTCATGCGTPGTQACNGTCTGYGACSGPEVCNGCDDDGVGGPDNSFTCVQLATSSCTTACGTAGTRTCNATCTGFSTCLAATETCGNGCDDDGDGMIDEGCGPANDLCGGAIAIAGASGSRAGTLVGATAQTSDCGSGVEVFYRVTVSSPSIVYLSTVGGATFDTRLSYRGTACPGASGQCVDDSCGSLQTHFAQYVGAGTHYFAVHTFYSGTVPGPFTLSWRIIATTAGPAVHVPDDDLPAPTTVQTYTGTTSGTGTLTPTACGLASAGTSAENLYYWAQCPADNRSYLANTCTGTTYDSTLWFRFNGVQIGCNDDSCGLQSTTSGAATGAGVVETLVDGYGAAAGPYTLTLTL